MKMMTLSVVMVAAFLTPSAHAEMTKEAQQALEQTQALLRDKNQRNEAMKNDANAKQNHQSLESLVGSGANTEAVYGLSADIFTNIVKDANGDPVAMQEKLMQAQKNPEAFLKSLSPDQQKSIESLAKKIEQERGPSNQPSNKP